MSDLGFLGGLALGRLAAAEDSRQDADATVDVMSRLRQRRADMSRDALINALSAENDTLRGELAILNDYIDRYKHWAEGEIARLERR
jgi:hypothetical protein